ncbi:annexin-like protein RJ4 [Beta vulgaris subsp. vulgaris]|uniref:annexin-like protein RJ4 n=1 Tax=Beta vulgaris subsp. vulgaris TaxID=3555 RepID=UPI002036EB83|nr:annexin-like protein RJ4 [Beta vulgaris subsp. vulgaris]
MTTLIIPDHADHIADAEALRKACQGWGTDEKGIINVICHRNAAHRKLIKEAYKQQYNEDLINRFEKELSGNFKKAVYLWMLDPFDREAVLAYEALKKADYQAVIELSCISSAEELLAVKRAYQIQYKHSLEEDVASHFSGDMCKLLLLLVSVYRHETEVSEPELVKAEAEILHNCIKDKAYNHDQIIRILTTRSKAQLISTFYCFGDVYGTSFAESLDSAHDQDFVAALQAAIRCIKCPLEYLEQVLADALMKHGTNEDALTRVIVKRAEKDLLEIKELFYKRHSRTLEQVVVKETHWDYETFILALLGKEDH